jgi:ribosomal protein S18 acetylase RimI-like enzyme
MRDSLQSGDLAMNLTNLKFRYAVEAPIGSAMLSADTQVIERHGWYQLITPSDKTGRMNEVMLSHINESEVADVVSKTIALYKNLKVSFKWATGPMSGPKQLGEMLRPLANSYWNFRGMAADVEMKISHPSNILVERVTEKNYEEYLDALILCWREEAGTKDSIRRKKHILLAEGSPFNPFLAKINNEPVGVSGYVMKSGYGYLIGAAVRPDFQKRGIYKALIKARLDDLQKKNVKIAVTQARESTSAPILERLGFETMFSAEIFKFDFNPS